jgi:hypothetical protein
MSLKLKLKTGLFRVLNMLPQKMGYAIYHRVQTVFGNNTLEKKLKSNHSSYRLLERICEKLEVSLQEKTILEIGSGWLPIMPYFFKFLGKAKSIATYDLNKHYNKKDIENLNRLFSSEFRVKLNENSNSNYALPEAIHYYPKTNLIYSEIADADLVFSRFVLEHVSPRDLVLMHKKFKKELKPGSYIIHLISPSDHRAYVDKNLSLQDFLQYSEAEWKQKQTRFDYHNRLRLPEYVEVFEKLDLEIVHLKWTSPAQGSQTWKKFKKVELNKTYLGFSDEELTAGSIEIVLKV